MIDFAARHGYTKEIIKELFIMEKNVNKKIELNDAEVESLLAEYNKQAETEGKHGYSELFHSDYSNYSDSCCCC